MTTLDKLQWRYATKTFDPSKKLSEQKFNLLLESLRLSASSFGLQPWKFVVVKNPAIRAELKKHSWGQAQVEDASHLIVLCSLIEITDEHVEHFFDSMCKIREQKRESLTGFESTVRGFLKKMDQPTRQKWMREQVYIALGSLLAVCAFEEVDSCPMEGFSPIEYDRILNLGAKGLKSVVVLPVGYRSESDKYSQLKKIRFPLNEVIEYVE